MKVHRFAQGQRLPIDLGAAWDFFSSPGNLDAITPPELGFVVEHCDEGPMYEGQIITYRIKLAPLVWTRWVTEIKAVEFRRSFIDEQRAGPYRFWHHRHTFEEVDGGVLMRDQVNYAVGFGPIGEIANHLFVRRKLGAIFAFRREILEQRFGAA